MESLPTSLRMVCVALRRVFVLARETFSLSPDVVPAEHTAFTIQSPEGAVLQPKPILPQ